MVFRRTIRHVQRTFTYLIIFARAFFGLPPSGRHRSRISVRAQSLYSSRDLCQLGHTLRCSNGIRERQLLKINRNPSSLLSKSQDAIQARQSTGSARVLPSAEFSSPPSLSRTSGGSVGPQLWASWASVRYQLQAAKGSSLVCSLDSHIPLFGCAIARFYETTQPLWPSNSGHPLDICQPVGS